MIATIAGLKVSVLEIQVAPPEGASIGVVQHIFPDFMQQQTQTNWCWAASGTSVGLFFQTGNWTQCDTANACLGRTDCCTTPVNCNVYGFLDRSLTYTLSFNSTFGGTYSAADIESQINLGRPVCVRVAWSGGGAHFLAMTGYSYVDTAPSTVTIYLQDSIYGASSMLLSDFPDDYHGGGSWTHTYLTQPHEGG